MHIRMLVARAIQDAGRQRPLSSGRVYDVPEVVAEGLVRDGSAELAEGSAEAPEDANAAALRAPDTKPDLPLETKRGRR